jgi:nucleotide-binding universal stress UspA family protein
MSYKTILAILQAQDSAARVMNCVAPLASRFSAHVIGLHTEPLPIPYASPMGFPDAGYIPIATASNRENAEAIRSVFQASLDGEGLSGEWRSMESFSGDSAISSLDSARCVDLIVAQQRDPDAESNGVANLEALLFETGRPVLFAPYAMPVQTAFERIIVGWNGSPEAARAVFDALPLIVAAKETEILTVDPQDYGGEEGVTAGAQIAAALARHGAKVTISNQRSAGLSHADVIQNRVAETGVQLLVTGAFSQSRLKEFFFGGVTRTLLQSMPCAVFMSR